MTIKCGFLDCNNPTRKGKNSCQNCDKREEWNICSACRQPEPKENEMLVHCDTLLSGKLFYQVGVKMRDKVVPKKFQAEFDQALSGVKLSEAEKSLMDQADKTVSEFLKEKGGKQDHEQWFKICSVCSPELDSLKKEFANQHPQFKNLIERMEKSQEKFSAVGEKIKQEVGKEKFEEGSEKALEQLEEELGDNWKNSQDGNNNSPNKNQNDNSTKITQLQQEINGLKQEICDLKNPRNPSPPSPNTLQEKENKLREKEKELDKLTGDSNSPSNKQPSKEGSSNLPLYFGLGALGVIIIILLTALLISQKKKKKPSLNWQNNWYNRLKNI